MRRHRQCQAHDGDPGRAILSREGGRLATFDGILLGSCGLGLLCFPRRFIFNDASISIDPVFSGVISESGRVGAVGQTCGVGYNWLAAFVACGPVPLSMLSRRFIDANTYAAPLADFNVDDSRS